jgi:ferredoxin-NADP reductase
MDEPASDLAGALQQFPLLRSLHAEHLRGLALRCRSRSYLVRNAAVGDKLLVHGPQGAFAMLENGMRSRWFVSGGTGLAPVLSMLRRMAEWGDPQPARLYAGFNDEGDLFAAGPIEELAGALSDFRAEMCLWRPNGGGGWRGFTGTPLEALKRDLAGSTETPDVYICGPPALIEAAEDALRVSGVPASQIIVERITAN